jgi:UDP-3-O-[3-hydroxymyristoyl] glucosamine N-acyltransferase
MIALLTPRVLTDLQRRHGGELDPGLDRRTIAAVAAVSADSNDAALVPLTSVRALPRTGFGARLVLVSRELRERVPVGQRWVHANPWWVLAELLEDAVVPWASNEPVIAPDASVAKTSVVLPGASVGPGCRLEEHSVVYGGVRLGARVIVGAGTVLGRAGFGFAHGPEGASRRIPQLGGVVIEDDVEIGALCTVDAGTLGPTVVGRGSKLDAHVHIGHNARVGARCFMAAQVGLAGSVEIEDDVWIGGQTGIADHVRVGRGARVAAKSGIVADIAPGAVVAGFPAVSRVRWLRRMAWLMRAKGPAV